MIPPGLPTNETVEVQNHTDKRIFVAVCRTKISRKLYVHVAQEIIGHIRHEVKPNDYTDVDIETDVCLPVPVVRTPWHTRSERNEEPVKHQVLLTSSASSTCSPGSVDGVE